MPYADPNEWDYKPLHLTTMQITNPFSVLEWFYNEHRDIVDTRKELMKLYSACFSLKCPLTVSEVVALQSLREDLIKLIEAADLLNGQGIDCELVSTDLMDTGNFFRKSQNEYDAWDYFPRFLNREEYIGPCKALRRFFQYRYLHQWRDILQDYFSVAVEDWEISADDHNIWYGYCLLGKLVEALYLITIRKTS